MRIVVRAKDLPGRSWEQHADVHVALQVRRDPVGPVPGDAGDATWNADVQVVDAGGLPDFRGPAVHGKRGERFLYLTWGDVAGGSFSMFRRLKLMLDDLGPDVTSATQAIGVLSMTDAKGGPLCGRVKPHQITWTLS